MAGLELATMSACGRYRYALRREPLQLDVYFPPVVFCLLNPSTADAKRDDATVRRLRLYSADWKCNGIVVVNLYAWRATDPRELRKAADPIGPDNDATLRSVAREHHSAILGWGANADPDRASQVVKLFREERALLMCFGRCAGGAPKHPLRLRADLKPIPFEDHA